MYTINVVHKRKHKSTPHDFYCGRPSPLGNPFSHLKKGTSAKFLVNSREEAIKKYEENFPEEFIKKEVNDYFFKIYNHLMEHKIVNLVCWCAPLSCHADIIKQELEDQYWIDTGKNINKQE